jgi:hypothetical protein
MFEWSPPGESSLPDPALPEGLARGHKRGTLMMSLLVATGLSFVPALGAQAVQLHLQLRAAGGEPVSEDETAMSDIILGLVALPLVVLLAVNLVVWFFWLHRSYANLRLIGNKTADHTARWAVGSWFIPFVNIFSAYRVMKELWWRSENGNSGFYGPDLPGPGLISGWWATYLGSSFLVRLSTRSFMEDVSAQYVTLLELGSTVLDIVSAVLAFLMVRQIRDFQDRWPALAANRERMSAGGIDPAVAEIAPT